MGLRSVVYRASRGARPALRGALLSGALLGGAVLSSSCLIDEPPDLVEPEREGPRILVETAVPSVFQPYQTSSGGSDPNFTVQFLIEDLGETIAGRLYLNYGSEDRQFIGFAESAATVTAAQPRSITIPWSFDRNGQEAGCYSLTMAISFAENFNSQDPFEPLVPEETGFITWWIAHDIEPQNVNLDECYPPDPLPLEADQ